MKGLSQLFAIIAASAVTVGCVSSKGYFGDRARDAADILTVTTGPGYGVDARFGPMSVGVAHTHDQLGLMCGEVFSRKYAELGPEHLVWLALFMDDMVPLPFTAGHRTMETNRQDEHAFRTTEQRHKAYEMGSFLFIPFFTYPTGEGAGYAKLYAATQIEASIGLGWAARIGFNPVEFLDFLLGWTTIDIFDDDLWHKTK